MEIEKIDRNFAMREKIVTEEMTVYDIPSERFALYGVYFEEKANAFVRMDTEVAERVNAGVASLYTYTAGGRIKFATDSAVLRIAVAYDYLGAMPHMALVGSSGFSLFEETEDGERYVAKLAPTYQDAKGYVAETRLPAGKMREYTLYFPLYNEVRRLSIALEKGASVRPGKPYRNIAPILYYGSSITQGGCASRPDNCYQALICKRNNIDFINLGFSGSAKGEKEMVSYLGRIKCSLFVCDYDYNAPSAAHLKATHYPLYESFRKAQPETPILFLSAPDYQLIGEAEERVRIIRSTYERAKKQGDKNVYFLSGKSYYGKKNCWDFAVDGCHPTDYGFSAMAEKIYRKMITIDRKFGGEHHD